MPDPVVNFVQSTPQNLIVPPFRNPGVVQLLDWSGNIINAANPLPVTITGTIGENVNISQFGGNAVVTGAGASGVGIPRVTVSNDSSVILAAGTNIIGATGTFGRIDVTPVVQNASYVSGNCLGGLISFTLPRTSSGILQSFSIQSIGGATTAINAFLFDANPSGSTFTDKSTFTIVAADEAKRINKSAYSMTPVALTGDAATGAEVTNLARAFSSTGTIYLALCSTGTFTPATTTDIRVAIGFVLNP